MAKLVQKNIDGKEYQFGLLNPFKANKLLIKLTKIIGPALGSMTKGGDVESIMDMDLSEVMEGLCSRLDEDQLETIMITLFEQVICEGDSMSQSFVETEFKGSLNTLYKVAFAALEVQFGDFFGGKGVLAGLKRKAAARLTK